MEDCEDLYDVKNIGYNFEDKIEETFLNYPNSPLFSPNQFCSSTTSSESGTCRGDSGAPAIFKGRSKDPLIQVGVLHGSSGENCDNSQLPSIFVRLDDPEIF